MKKFDILTVVSVIVINTIFAARAVFAEDSVRIVTAEPLVVTARAWPEQQSALPASVALIMPGEMLNGNIVGIGDLVDEVPGISSTGESPWAADMSIRGLSRDNIILMIDGCRVVTANDLAGRMAFIHPDEIERIEILKGPVSVLYGSGALGGVVNVVTHSAKFEDERRFGNHGSLSFGDNPSGYGVRYAAELLQPGAYSAVSVGTRDYDSYEDGDGETVHNSGFEDGNLTARFGRKLREDWITEAQIQLHLGREIGIPGTGTAPLPATADVTYEDAHRVMTAIVNRWNVNGRWWRNAELNVYFQQINRDVRIDRLPAAGPVSEIRPSGRHDTAGVRWLNNFEAGTHTVGAGFESWRRELDSTRLRLLKNGTRITERPLPEAWEWASGFFVEDRWGLREDLTLSAGLRGDILVTKNKETVEWAEDRQHDLNWNTHIGVSWRPSAELTLRGVVAAGYRAPSIEERYQYLVLGGGKVKLGDPELEAERSVFTEGGLNWQGDVLRLQLSGFINTLDDLVSEKVEDEQTLRNANVASAKIEGVEAAMDFVVGNNWLFNAALTFLRGEDRNSGEPLAGIAPFNTALGIRYEDGRGWFAKLQQIYTAEQDRTPDGVDPVNSWSRVNFFCGYSFRAGRTGHEIRAGIRNLLDETYRDYLSTWRGAPYNEPGRSLDVAWTVDF